MVLHYNKHFIALLKAVFQGLDSINSIPFRLQVSAIQSPYEILTSSDVCKSNDSKETKWLLEYIEEEIVRQYKEQPFFKGPLIYGLDETTTLELIVNLIGEKNVREKRRTFLRSTHRAIRPSVGKSRIRQGISVAVKHEQPNTVA